MNDFEDFPIIERPPLDWGEDSSDDSRDDSSDDDSGTVVVVTGNEVVMLDAWKIPEKSAFHWELNIPLVIDISTPLYRYTITDLIRVEAVMSTGVSSALQNRVFQRLLCMSTPQIRDLCAGLCPVSDLTICGENRNGLQFDIIEHVVRAIVSLP